VTGHALLFSLCAPALPHYNPTREWNLTVFAATAGAAMIFRVEVSASAKPTTVFEHDGPALHVGRDPACELPLDGSCDGVSWHHARIDATPRGFVLQDLGSRNGTFVNDQRIAAPTLLQPGDAIRLGQRGPELKLTTLNVTPPDTSTDGTVTAQSGLHAAPVPAGPHQPPSDNRPTLAGVLTPLGPRPSSLGTSARFLGGWPWRNKILVIIFAGVLLLVSAVLALKLAGGLP